MSWVTSWLEKAASALAGQTSYVVNAVTSYLEGLFEILMNAVSSVFIYVLSNVIDLFAYFINLLPELPDNILAVTSQIPTIIGFAYRMNVYLPVVETVLAFCFLTTFVSIFVGIKFVLKLIPTIG